MLVALDPNVTRTIARSATKETPYHCPECSGNVILKQGRVKVAHFAHVPGDDTCPNAGESMKHLLLKERLYKLVLNETHKAELEWPLPGVRADILSRVGEQLVAFEIQVSAAPLEEIQAKLRRYTQLKIACIYVIDGDAIKTNEDGEFRCPRWIRALHALYYGRVYAFSPSCASIGQVHFDRATRWVETAHDCNGEEVGGYMKTLRTTKEPVYGPPVELSSLKAMLTSSSEYQPFPGRFLLGLFDTRRFWPK